MKITVILCTYNRCQILERALNSLSSSNLSESVDWEILVVDNNSSDETRDVVQDFCRRYPGHFRYLFEGQQGKSYALNAGIREAKGDILAFTDDDVTVEPTWLQNLTAGLNGTEWAGAGGRILPVWTCSQPKWLSLNGRHTVGPVVMFDLGTQPGRCHQAPFGPNMAFKKKLFEKYGGFRTDLGPSAHSVLGGNEDTEFGSRLLACGEQLRYEPSAVVFHPVPEHRMRKQYFLSWWFDRGILQIRQSGVRPGTKYYVGSVPVYLLRSIAVWALRWIITIRPDRRFDNKLTVWEKLGGVTECYRSGSGKNSSPEDQLVPQTSASRATAE